jgi:hypothetical protein
LIFKHKEKEQKFSRYDLCNQGIINTRVKFCWFPTTLSNKDIVWLEYVNIVEKGKLCQGFSFSNFYVVWKTQSVTLMPTP